MVYCFSKLEMKFGEAVAHVASALTAVRFGVLLPTIDLRAIMKNKLGVELERSAILAACNYLFAWRTSRAENKCGLVMRCKIVMTGVRLGMVEVTTVDPEAALAAANDNPGARRTASAVRRPLQQQMVGRL